MKLENMYKRNANPKLYEEEQDLQNCGSFALSSFFKQTVKWFSL